jgi:hypothetical protein
VGWRKGISWNARSNVAARGRDPALLTKLQSVVTVSDAISRVKRRTKKTRAGRQIMRETVKHPN